MAETSDTPLATLPASAVRRGLALLVFWALAVLVLSLALRAELGFGARVGLIAFSAAVLWMAERLRRATQVALVLTHEGLHDSTGRLLCRMEDIKSLDRGLFAFKPPNGFCIVLKEKGPSAFHTGLWWRVGRRLGIGGVTAPGAGKFMAEMLAQELVKRDASAGLR